MLDGNDLEASTAGGLLCDVRCEAIFVGGWQREGCPASCRACDIPVILKVRRSGRGARACGFVPPSMMWLQEKCKHHTVVSRNGRFKFNLTQA